MTDSGELDETGFAGELVEAEIDDDLNLILTRLNEDQQYLLEMQQQLHDEFERLAHAVTPLLTTQYKGSEQRIRVLETRLRNRQERPLIKQVANLLFEVRRLESADDIKVHVEEALLQALNDLGYEETASVGDQFDPDLHEPLSGSIGRAGVVSQVFQRGLACHGDAIIKAKVEVAPVTEIEAEPATPAELVDADQGGFPA